MTRVIQYSVPVKYTTPAVRPRENERPSDPLPSASSSGVSAIQLKAGWPKWGKLSASRTPEAAASAYSNRIEVSE
jgi:hypothetical protein